MFFLFLRPRSATLFPYTTLFRSIRALILTAVVASAVSSLVTLVVALLALPYPSRAEPSAQAIQPVVRADRKSTRLNSSHRCISYAVFCLKKKLRNDDVPQVLHLN